MLINTTLVVPGSELLKMFDGKLLFSLSDQVVFITGGAGYLGSAMVNSLLAFGAKVAVADLTKWKMEQLTEPAAKDRGYFSSLLCLVFCYGVECCC